MRIDRRIFPLIGLLLAESGCVEQPPRPGVIRSTAVAATPAAALADDFNEGVHFFASGDPLKAGRMAIDYLAKHPKEKVIGMTMIQHVNAGLLVLTTREK